MTTTNIRFTSPILLLGLFLVGCGPREADARKYLEAQGFTDVAVKKDGKIFTYTATKGESFCTGTLGMSKSLGSTTTSNTSQCGLDTRGCKPGAAAVCMKLADDLYNKEAKVFPNKAAELYGIACADHEARGCARMSEFEIIEKAYDKARDFAKKSCDASNGEGCRRLATTELEGQGTTKNIDTAIQLAKKACDLGDTKGCRIAAGLLVDNAKPFDALPMAEKLCAAKFEDGCFVLGAALFDVKKDYPRALEYLDAACDDSKLSAHGMACNLAGAITLGALGMKRDSKRGIAYLESSCAANYAEGCGNAAKMYRSGANGVTKNKAKGDEFAAKACTLGNKDFCASH